MLQWRRRHVDNSHRRRHTLTSDARMLEGSRPKETREVAVAFARGVVLAPVPLPTHLGGWIWRTRHGEEHEIHVNKF